MDTSTAQQSEENESLIVHVDDTQNDLDADLLTSQTNRLKSRQAAKEKAIGKTEGKKSDVGSSPPETGSETGGGGGSVDVSCDKGNTDDVKKTEKKPDEKKDGKLKSCSPVLKLKIVKNLKGDNQNSRNLWISGLSSNAQAADMKALFSKYGKVVAVKVVTNAHTPGARYVFLTMSSSEEAAKCIQHLNQTELHGKKMSVAMAKNNLSSQTVKKAETKLGDKKTVVKKEGVGQNSRNLWISGLSSNTRATDLKGLFSKYGKVVDAKVVTNVRSPGARCYGFLTMYSSEDASKCIQHLNQTELHGKMISVEKAKNDPGLQSVKKIETKPAEKKTEKPEVKKEMKEVTKKDGDKKEDIKKRDEKDRKPVFKRDDKRHSSTASHRKPLDKSKGEPVISVKRGGKEGGGTDKSKMSAGKEKLSTTPKAKSKETPTAAEGSKDENNESQKDVISFNLIKAKTERVRKRESHWRLRQKRRLQELDRVREIRRDVQRRQEGEAMRLEKMTERLRMERETLERVKHETAKWERAKLERERIKLEREYLEQERIRTERRRAEIHRMEREKLERVKLERAKLERERIKLEREYLEQERLRTEQRRAEIHRFEEQQRRALKRTYERSSVQHEEGYWNEPKRPAINTPSSNRFEHGFTNESRREVGPSRDRSSDRNHETDRRELGPDRGRDSDRKNVSSHDRLGRVRNSPAVSQPPPPPPPPPTTSDHPPRWGSGIERKVDTWSQPHSNMDNSGVNRPNDRWINNNMAPNHDRRPTSRAIVGSGGYVGGSGGGSGSSGMVQNMGHSNVYVNPQTQSSGMVVGGSNMGGRIQEPRFDTYMQRY